MTLQEFEQEIFTVALRSSICDIPHVRRLTATAINLRISLLTDTTVSHRFIEVFFNEQTGRTAFAVIEADGRVFGADNTGGWHIHPFVDPSRHQPIDSPMPFADFIATVERYFQEK